MVSGADYRRSQAWTGLDSVDGSFSNDKTRWNICEEGRRRRPPRVSSSRAQERPSRGQRCQPWGKPAPWVCKQETLGCGGESEGVTHPGKELVSDRVRAKYA